MYKIVKCSNCKKFQMSTAEKVFKCVFCTKSKLMTKKKIYFQSADAMYSVDVLKRLKKEVFESEKPKYKDDFV